MLGLTNHMFQAIAILVSITLVAWALGLHTLQIANAANLNSVSNTLSDSAPTETSSHTISFTIPTGSTLASGDTVSITFDTQDDGAGGQDFVGIAGSVTGDISVTVDTVADAHGSFVSDADSISFDSIDAAAGQVVEVTIADGVITNPATTDSYEVEVDTGNGDVGRTRVVIIDNVLVTAIVDTVFDFTVSGVPEATPINGSPTTTASTTTDVLLPFGTLSANTSVTLAQQLNVTTNAIHGFIVTVEQDANILSSTGADIDGFVDGSYTDTPQAWENPGNLLADENTWGHWALTTEDTDLEGAGADFAADQWVAASTTPRVIMAYDDPADGVAAGIGSTTVGYQIAISPLQEAGDDYNTTLTYIATPTF